MSLKSVLETLEGLDPVFHEHYSERTENGSDGKAVTRYYLDIEDDIRRHPKGKSLQAALDRTKEEKRRLTEKLEELEAKIAELPENFDAEQFAKDMDDLTALRKKLEDKGGGESDPGQAESLKRLYDQRITNLEKKHGEERVKLEGQIRELEAEIERLVADEGLTKHLVAVGVDKKLMPGATALLRRSVKVRKEDDGNRLAIVDTPDGEVPLDEYINNWAQSDEGAVYVQKATGGGAPGGEGVRVSDNPFVSDPKVGRKPNLTRMQELIKNNPVRARQLAQAAGWSQDQLKQHGI